MYLEKQLQDLYIIYSLRENYIEQWIGSICVFFSWSIWSMSVIRRRKCIHIRHVFTLIVFFSSVFKHINHHLFLVTAGAKKLRTVIFFNSLCEDDLIYILQLDYRFEVCLILNSCCVRLHVFPHFPDSHYKMVTGHTPTLVLFAWVNMIYEG